MLPITCILLQLILISNFMITDLLEFDFLKNDYVSLILYLYILESLIIVPKFR